MSDIAEGIGGAIEGVLAGRAVEPETSGAGSLAVGSDANQKTCRNCSAHVTASYCPECGQKAHVHRTLSAILHDLIHGVLHLDGKFWLTLPMLIFKPGQLTRRYIEGERAKFVSPMAMFLFSVFAMFAVFQMVGIGVPTELNANPAISQTVQTARAAAEADATALRDELSELPPGDPRRQSIAQELRVVEQGIDGLSKVDLMQFGDNGRVTFDGTGIDWLDEGIVKKWTENPSLMLYKLQSNGYKFSWLLIPLSVPFVWLIFAWKRRFKAYDHAIFVTYSLSFMSLLFILVSLIGTSALGGGWAFSILATLAPLHVYRHLKSAYNLGWFSTLWRFLALLVFIVTVLGLFLQALLLLGAF
ncbi:DUF3667 domain-containing protein [Qipengyuania sp. ASV99]|uniref:DUF3667 domain-containing protein n=1 Tax=Qipengyuania sp. ASV99 TaxID=3399681 RepID=UPI003A4C5AEA